jgi:hypothetical protein
MMDITLMSPSATVYNGRHEPLAVEMMRPGLDKAGIFAATGARFKPKDAVLRLLERI